MVPGSLEVVLVIGASEIDPVAEPAAQVPPFCLLISLDYISNMTILTVISLSSWLSMSN